ncbi:MAG: SLC13 family permease [Methanoregulaceae archaeon]|nr:SLC13 family permease [Methanoregulaceae archaeon]
MEISLVILLAVFLLIAVRQVGRFRFHIWQVMCAGAVAVLITGQISLPDAAQSVNLGVMVFLFGMFVVGEALSESGYLFTISKRLVSCCRNSWQFITLFILSMAFLSAFLMNDTIAIIGTPLALYLGNRLGLSVKMLLLALCFAITTGSVFSPIGNPQNLLIATECGYFNPFGTFFLYLGIPTIISLVVLVLFFRLFYLHDAGERLCITEEVQPADPGLVRLLKVSFTLIISCIILQVLLTLHPFGIAYTLPLPAIAIAGAAPIILFSRKRVEIIRKIDWPTLVFFISMFVLMAAVFATGVFQAAVPAAATSSVVLLYSTSLLISQLISNVPFVALFTPLFQQAGMSVNGTMALAAGSTLAGNLTILGAASNVIVIQNAERQGETITFMEFLRLGIPFTLITGVIFVTWLTFI